MSLAERCRPSLSAATRSKGEQYFRAGRVNVDAYSDHHVEASVRGSSTESYTVTLDWSDPREGVRAVCSCPRYEDDYFCKHLWAVMLAADRRGITSGLTGRKKLQLIHKYDQDDPWQSTAEPAADALPEIARDILARLFGQRAALKGHALPKARTPKVEAWYGGLSGLPVRAPALDGRGRSSPGEQPRPRRALFVIDAGATARGGLVTINLYFQEEKKNGDWGKPKALKVSRSALDRFPAEDRRLLALALGNYTGTPWGYGDDYPLHAQSDAQVSRIELIPQWHDILLPQLCASGRLGWVLGYDQGPGDARPLVWDDGEPWRFRLIVEDKPRDKVWIVRGEFVRHDEAASVEAPVLVLSSGLLLLPDRIARLGDVPDWRWLSLLRSRGDVRAPYADRERLLAELYAGGSCAAETLPATLQAEVLAGEPRGRFRVHPAPQNVPAYAGRDLLYADVQFDYGGRLVGLNGGAGAIVDEGRVVIRDPAAEERLGGQIAALRIADRQPNYYYNGPGDVQFAKSRLTEVVMRLAGQGWQVEAEGLQLRSAGSFRAAVTSGVDWFDLETAIDFDGASASLPELLAALQRGERFVKLDDGSQGILPQEWLERFAPLAGMAEVVDDRLRFRPSQALLLDALLADRQAQLQVRLDEQFTRLRDGLQSFAGVAPRDAPEGFRGELRPYQKEGLGWLAFLNQFRLGGCLADDMGLGKTVQLLAWLLAHRGERCAAAEPQRPSLVIAPKSVVFNWELETQRFAPGLHVLNYTGLSRRAQAEQLPQADLVITTYGTLRRDVETLKDVRFDYVILDEAQAIKNDKSVSAKACRLLQADHRLALTGTPIENRLDDLWSIFEFLNPGMLGRSTALRSFGRNGGGRETAALDSLRRGLAPFILRRTKEQVLNDLPEKNEQTLYVELSPADRKRYQELRDHYRHSLLHRVSQAGMNAARMHVLEALLRLRQAACHAGLLDKKLADKPSAKLEALLEQTGEIIAEGHKALVFSQFTSLLALVRRALDERGVTYEYLDGRTRNRQAKVERFQNDPACPLFLVSLKAGGAGLNLTAADYVYLLDPWWNPAVEAQAVDRAHRIGQQRPVFAYRIVARDTVEEKILQLQQQKRELADAIITADDSLASRLSLDDLQTLLS